MNSKCQGIPDQRTNLPKYKYHLPPPRSSHYHRQHQQSNKKYATSTYHRDNSGRKGTYQDFSFFDENTHESIAKELIEENMLLREEVLQSRDIIRQLELENECYRRELQERDRIELRNEGKECAQQFRQQILYLLEKNKAIEQEISTLKAALEYQCRTANQTRKRSTSLDIKRRSQDQSHQSVLEPHSKNEELLSSIRGMYFKIMGFKAESLKELWRWLKQMGYTYSHLHKWSQKAKAHLHPSQPPPHLLGQLLQEVLQILR